MRILNHTEAEKVNPSREKARKTMTTKFDLVICEEFPNSASAAEYVEVCQRQPEYLGHMAVFKRNGAVTITIYLEQ